METQKQEYFNKEHCYHKDVAIKMVTGGHSPPCYDIMGSRGEIWGVLEREKKNIYIYMICINLI